MANTFSQVYLHIVFSTKNRAPLIRPEFERDIWTGIGGCARKHKMVPIQIGGMEDHAHALVSTPTTISPSQAAKYLKGDSSLWIHREFAELRDFGWQDGYGVFSVSRSAVPNVIKYIQDQRLHHQEQSFENEYVTLLKLHGVDHDERYLFD